MNEIEIFADPLSANVFEWASLAIIFVYAGIAVYLARRTPDQLPVSIVRRAL